MPPSYVISDYIARDNISPKQFAVSVSSAEEKLHYCAKASIFPPQLDRNSPQKDLSEMSSAKYRPSSLSVPPPAATLLVFPRSIFLVRSSSSSRSCMRLPSSPLNPGLKHGAVKFGECGKTEESEVLRCSEYHPASKHNALGSIRSPPLPLPSTFSSSFIHTFHLVCHIDTHSRLTHSTHSLPPPSLTPYSSSQLFRRYECALLLARSKECLPARQRGDHLSNKKNASSYFQSLNRTLLIRVFAGAYRNEKEIFV